MNNYIFDFDGTIADSFWLIIDIAHNLTNHPKLLDKNLINKLRDNSLSDLTSELNIPKYRWPLLLRKGRIEMKSRLNEVKIISNMDLVIEKLFKSGHKLYILSNNSKENLINFLEEYNLVKCFNDIYGDIGLFKKAKYLNKIIKQNKLTKENVIYVGDETRDILASKKINIKVAAVTWGFNSPKVLKLHNPDFIINNPMELLKIK